jgi:hypothetical protein
MNCTPLWAKNGDVKAKTVDSLTISNLVSLWVSQIRNALGSTLLPSKPGRNDPLGTARSACAGRDEGPQGAKKRTESASGSHVVGE